MPEAFYQFLTLNREMDSPEIGELREGEITINLANGRLWVGDEFSVPVELGGNSQERLVSLGGGNSNYISVEVSSPEVFPISIPDPNSLTPGTYRELYLHVWYPQTYMIPNHEPVGYVTSPIEWDAESHPPGMEIPFIRLRGAGKHLVFKLFAFGPRQSWFGKVIWVSR